MAATAACFFGPMEFGSPIWRSALIALVIGYCLFINFGRGLIVRCALLLTIAALVEFSEAAPPLANLASEVGTAIARAASN